MPDITAPTTTDSISDQLTKAQAKIKSLEEINSKISQNWLQIEREKSRLSGAINSLGVGFAITDDHNNIVTKNLAFETILGPESRNWTLADIEKHAGSTCNLNELCTKSIQYKVSNYLFGIPISNMFLNFIISPITILKEGLATVGATILIEDVTTARIADHKRSEYFAVASHELKSPLTVIRSSAEMILETYSSELTNPKLISLLKDIHSESLRLISIIHDFLDVARLEEGKIKFKKIAFATTPIIQEVIGNFAPLANFKGIYLNFDPIEELPPVIADQEGVKHVLFNLIDNAIKFTKKGGIAISAVNQGEFLQISVTDTGEGIPAEKQKILFEKFIVTDNPKSSSGIGLYIARLFTEGMGGKIMLVKTAQNVGTTFAFTVPLAKPN